MVTEGVEVGFNMVVEPQFQGRNPYPLSLAKSGTGNASQHAGKTHR